MIGDGSFAGGPEHGAHAQERREGHGGHAARQDRAHNAGSLAIDIGFPCVHRSEAHLCAVTDEQQYPRSQDPWTGQARPLRAEGDKSQIAFASAF